MSLTSPAVERVRSMSPMTGSVEGSNRDIQRLNSVQSVVSETDGNEEELVSWRFF